MLDKNTLKEKLSEPDLLLLAQQQYQKAVEYWNQMWEKGRDDIEFKNGTNHWPEKIRKDRTTDGRPCLIINHALKYIRQVVGDQRQNRPQAKVRPVDGQADVDLAKHLTGLLLNIENNSNFKTVQDTAFNHSVSNSFGYIRIVTEYAADDTFEQDIRYKRVFNPFSVVLDPAAVELDHSDGMFGFVTDWVPNDIFKKKYPDAALSDFDAAQRTRLTDWYHQDETLTAEYFRKIPVNKTLGLLSDGKTIDINNVDVTKEGQFGMMPDGITPVTVLKTKVVEAYKVMRYLISGTNVLEDGVEFPGIYIPLIPVWGEETITKEGRRDFNSVIRFMKDPNRMLNFMRSAEVEHIALQPKVPFIGTAKQFENYEDDWDEANKKNFGRLTYNPDPDAKMPPQRQMPPQASSGIQLGIKQAKEDMEDTTGLSSASEAMTKEVSGKAILARQREGDISTFVWIDNLTTAITFAAKVVLGMIPHVYDTERQVRISSFDGSEEFIDINKEIEGEDGKPLIVNDLSVGKYDVVVETGASYNTQRIESGEKLLEFARVMGQDVAAIMGDIIAKTQDFAGASELSDRLRKMLPPGIAELKEGETPPEPPPPPAPTPEDELKAQELEVKKEQIQLDYAKIEVEAKKIEAEVVKAKMEQGLSAEQVESLILQKFKELHAE